MEGFLCNFYLMSTSRSSIAMPLMLQGTGLSHPLFQTSLLLHSPSSRFPLTIPFVVCFCVGCYSNIFVGHRFSSILLMCPYHFKRLLYLFPPLPMPSLFSFSFFLRSWCSLALTVHSSSSNNAFRSPLSLWLVSQISAPYISILYILYDRSFYAILFCLCVLPIKHLFTACLTYCIL